MQDTRFADLTVLVETVSEFWTRVFADREFIHDYLRGCAYQERQIAQREEEWVAAFGRRTCPAWHTKLWQSVVLFERDGRSAAPYRGNDSRIYTESLPTDGLARDTSREFPIGEEVSELQCLADDLVEPHAVLHHGVDFYLARSRGKLVFRTNPFFDSRLRTTTDAEDRRIALYAYTAKHDSLYLQSIYGHLVGLESHATTPNYAAVVNAALDCVSSGTSLLSLKRLIAAWTDIPIAAGDEVVEDIVTDGQSKVVITSKNVYRVPAAATVSVAVGNTLHEGQTICDSLLVAEIRDAAPAGVTSLTLTTGWDAAVGNTALTFSAAASDLAVTENVSGFTKIQFGVGGAAGAVASLFTELHAKGVAAGATLANYLTTSQSTTQQPTSASLPASLSPLQFLCKNVLNRKALLCRITGSKVGKHAMSLTAVPRLMRQLTSPHTRLICEIGG